MVSLYSELYKLNTMLSFQKQKTETENTTKTYSWLSFFNCDGTKKSILPYNMQCGKDLYCLGLFKSFETSVSGTFFQTVKAASSFFNLHGWFWSCSFYMWTQVENYKFLVFTGYMNTKATVSGLEKSRKTVAKKYNLLHLSAAKLDFSSPSIVTPLVYISMLPWMASHHQLVYYKLKSTVSRCFYPIDHGYQTHDATWDGTTYHDFFLIAGQWGERILAWHIWPVNRHLTPPALDILIILFFKWKQYINNKANSL